MSDYETTGGYPMQSMGGSNMPSAVMAPTLKLRMEQAVKDCESRLADAVRAREILNAHPELEELLDIMQKGLF